MFIDERNQLQFESVEELAANKEIAIKGVLDWEMPTVEELTKQLDEVSQLIDAEYSDVVIETFENSAIYAQEIVDNVLQNSEVSSKLKEYFNRCIKAYELVMSK